MQKGDDVLFYLPKDSYSNLLTWETIPIEKLFRKTARVGVITEIHSEGSYQVSYGMFGSIDVDAPYIVPARVRSWNSYFTSFVNPLEYHPGVVLGVGLAGFLIFKTFK